jgi:hypothetical protein
MRSGGVRTTPLLSHLTPSRSRRFQLLSSRHFRLKTFVKLIFSRCRAKRAGPWWSAASGTGLPWAVDLRASLMLPSAAAAPVPLPATEIALAQRPVDLFQPHNPRASQKGRGAPQHNLCAARTRRFTTCFVTVASAIARNCGTTIASSAALRPAAAPEAPPASDPHLRPSASTLLIYRSQYRRR